MLLELSILVYCAQIAYAVSNAASSSACKCIPSASCWPSDSLWNSLNHTVQGQLIRDAPLAQPCYKGPQYNEVQCALVDREWRNATFQQLSPVGLCYPSIVQCPPVNSSHAASKSGCALGISPTYTVNATKPAHVAAAIKFASKNNIRLVIRNTGHDLLDRSTGQGSLQTGSAFTIGGGYIWSDVYPEAEKRNLLVVGGGTPSVGVLGGWMQGGGHSPATHNFGLGADQILEARVMLANTSIVTANSCQHSDLFTAIRGGGPGTYGIVLSTTIKACPSPNVVVQTLAIVPLTENTSLFMEALADIYTAFPALSDGGFSGYGSWSIASPAPIFATFTAGYAHAIATMHMSQNASELVAAPLITKLQSYNTSQLLVNVAYYSVPTYADYYSQFSGSEPPVGTISGLGSRLLDEAALTASRSALLDTLTTLAGTTEQQTSQAVVFVGGGAVFADAADPYSGVNPAWRSTYVHHIVSRSINATAPQADAELIRNDVTYNKTAALKALAPNTGAYMNEGDRLDPEWRKDFYGKNWDMLSSVKETYDPTGLFYCPTCVGSGKWEVAKSGALCKA